jgi:hypothetical protein
MSQVADQVVLVVRDFLQNGKLFTALDVSNKVKETYPEARHREVRDVVRSLFDTEMVNSNYASTPIRVTLSDGVTQADALLYHPLVDSWDLDAKYDAQKRAQVSVKPSQSGPTPVVSNSGTSASVAADGTVSVNTVKRTRTSCFPKVVVPPDPVVSATTPPPVTVQKVSAKDAWTNLFNSQPSLFPRKS